MARAWDRTHFLRGHGRVGVIPKDFLRPLFWCITMNGDTLHRTTSRPSETPDTTLCGCQVFRVLDATEAMSGSQRRRECRRCRRSAEIR